MRHHSYGEPEMIKVGEISVDAGLCMIGDPCYQVDTGRDHAGWMAFLERNGLLTGWDMSHPVEDGKAIVVSTGYGDGTYPVYVEVEHGRVASVTVRFMEEEDDE